MEASTIPKDPILHTQNDWEPLYSHVTKEMKLPLEGNSAGVEQGTATLFVGWKRQRGQIFGGGSRAGHTAICAVLPGNERRKMFARTGGLPAEINPRGERSSWRTMKPGAGGRAVTQPRNPEVPNRKLTPLWKALQHLQQQRIP